ncbi:CDP-alcohol phosphatidyltransferase family protein [bacterium]|nr:CDP-alcohol phosphatidyltransferase family protein [bacterium]MCI0603433.1 CDP-alcohol phosphatidyltransferase family protein [bacterium]
MLQTAIFNNPERIQLSVLSNLEKRTLLWLAQRMPRKVNSDHLTTLGFLGMLLAGITYWMAGWNNYALFLVILFLAVNWFGDSLDGTLARVRNQQRPRYGFYVDHVIDAFGILFLVAGLALSGYMSLWVAAGFLIAYYLLSNEIALATVSLGKFRLSFGLFGPTELRILLASGNIVLFFHPVIHLFGQQFKLFDVGGVIGIAALLLIVLHSAIKNTLTLYREERI